MILQVLGVGLGFPLEPRRWPPPTNVTEVTRSLVVTALEDAGFQVQDPRTSYKPGESPELITVPRRLVLAVTPEDPDAGYVVIYELPDANEADRVGREFPAYLGGGTGAIQYPRDTQFVLRRIGPRPRVLPVVGGGLARRPGRRAGRGARDGRVAGGP